jgi:hypothetical protein
MIQHRTRTTYWWLGPGSRRCAGCEISIHEAILIYCAACDRPFCPLCIIAIQHSHELTCHNCHGCESQETSDMAEET